MQMMAWAEPAWRQDGVTLMFQRLIGARRFEIRRQMLRLTSTLDDLGRAAQDIAQQLLSTFPDGWADSFGYHRPRVWLPPTGLRSAQFRVL
jgi:hypothetical protein